MCGPDAGSSRRSIANPPRSPVVALACAEDDAQGEELSVFWEYEPDRQIVSSEGWERIGERGFDEPRTFAAFMNTLRWGSVTATDSNLFQAPFRAGIKIDAYQMEPLRKALRLPRVNLFIADDTGLGKTIEAGLIARELLLRKQGKTIVVAAPPSVLQQWKAELEERFGLTFEILDRALRRPHAGASAGSASTRGRRTAASSSRTTCLSTRPTRTRCGTWLGDLLPGQPADPRRGPPRGAGERRALRDRDEVHARGARPRRPLRAPPVPVRDAAQRPLEQLLDAA